MYEGIWEWCVRVWGRDYDYMRVCMKVFENMCEGVRKGLWLYESMYEGIWEWCVKVWGRDYDYMRVCMKVFENDVWGCEEGIKFI